MNTMTAEQKSVWESYRQGRIDFRTLQATYPGGGIPDSVGRLGHGLERPWTKQQTEFMEKLSKKVVDKIKQGEG